MLERLKKLRIAPIIQYIWSRTSDFFKKGDMFLLVMCCIGIHVAGIHEKMCERKDRDSSRDDDEKSK